jgi:cysteine-rich repeat protein
MDIRMISQDGIRKSLLALVVGMSVALAAQVATAKTPDGQTPSTEDVCSGLTGAAYGLCNAYCEAQDCDVHNRPSCAVLRRNFARLTGSPVFPCDPRCGDGHVNQASEECDDGNNAECDGCSPTCKKEFCGDGVLCPGGPRPGPRREQCDDGNNAACDGCSPRCTREFCGDGVVCPNQGEECDPPGNFCGDGDEDEGFVCSTDCKCPRCPINDRIIDSDGSKSPDPGAPETVDVRCGDRLSDFQGNPEGLDMFDNDGNGLWTFGPGGDDLHVEDPNNGICPTAIRDGLHQLGQDCKVLDVDGSLFDGQNVTCDFGANCVPFVRFHDRNGDGVWNNGEDIVYDGNDNHIFD